MSECKHESLDHLSGSMYYCDDCKQQAVGSSWIAELKSTITAQQAEIERLREDIRCLTKADIVRVPTKDSQQARIAELEDSVRFFAIRCEELQEIQSRMRDPERQMVCDILANGKPRDKAGIGEYKALAALLQE